MQNKVYTDHLQLTLPIEFAQSVVRAHGLSVAHPRPLVSYGKDYGRVFCFRTSPRKAWRYAEVEYANAVSSLTDSYSNSCHVVLMRLGRRPVQY